MVSFLLWCKYESIIICYGYGGTLWWTVARHFSRKQEDKSVKKLKFPIIQVDDETDLSRKYKPYQRRQCASAKQNKHCNLQNRKNTSKAINCNRGDNSTNKNRLQYRYRWYRRCQVGKESIEVDATMVSGKNYSSIKLAKSFLYDL